MADPRNNANPISELMDACGLLFDPRRILKSGKATIVFWIDGSKTVVRRAPDTAPSDYDAFTAALAIRVFGSNSALKKLITQRTQLQLPKAKKPALRCEKDWCELDAPEEPEGFDSAE